MEESSRECHLLQQRIVLEEARKKAVNKLAHFLGPIESHIFFYHGSSNPRLKFRGCQDISVSYHDHLYPKNGETEYPVFCVNKTTYQVLEAAKEAAKTKSFWAFFRSLIGRK